MAVFCGFWRLRMLRSSALGIDNGSREGHALAALGLAAKRAIGLAGAHRTTARGVAHLTFPNGIAYAHDHRIESLTSLDEG
jgi:hypothetical protein